MSAAAGGCGAEVQQGNITVTLIIAHKQCRSLVQRQWLDNYQSDRESLTLLRRNTISLKELLKNSLNLAIVKAVSMQLLKKLLK